MVSVRIWTMGDGYNHEGFEEGNHDHLHNYDDNDVTAEEEDYFGYS